MDRQRARRAARRGQARPVFAPALDAGCRGPRSAHDHDVPSLWRGRVGVVLPQPVSSRTRAGQGRLSRRRQREDFGQNADQRRRARDRRARESDAQFHRASRRQRPRDHRAARSRRRAECVRVGDAAARREGQPAAVQGAGVSHRLHGTRGRAARVETRGVCEGRREGVSARAGSRGECRCARLRREATRGRGGHALRRG